MRTIRKNVILILVVSGMIVSCRDPFFRYAMIVTNKSTSDVYITFPTLRMAIDRCIMYPDTTIWLKPVERIPKGEERGQTPGTTTLENWFSYFPNDTVSFFFFDAEVVESVPWETVVNEYMILQRYDLSIEDLKKLNGHITYPPSAEMQEMHMFPPYEEAIKNGEN